MTNPKQIARGLAGDRRVENCPLERRPLVDVSVPKRIRLKALF